MSKAYKSIMRGLEEIKAHNEGRARLKSTEIEIAAPPRYDAESVRELRSELRLSQSAFAEALGVSKKTVEAWEAGRNEPSGSACRLLELVGNDKDILERQKIVAFS
jgi:putative transcriptional regulator